MSASFVLPTRNSVFSGNRGNKASLTFAALISMAEPLGAEPAPSLHFNEVAAQRGIQLNVPAPGHSAIQDSY